MLRPAILIGSTLAAFLLLLALSSDTFAQSSHHHRRSTGNLNPQSAATKHGQLPPRTAQLLRRPGPTLPPTPTDDPLAVSP